MINGIGRMGVGNVKTKFDSIKQFRIALNQNEVVLSIPKSEHPNPLQ